MDSMSAAAVEEPSPAAVVSLPEDPRNLTQAGKELLRLSLPFIVSTSCTTVQIFIDRIFVSGVNADAVAAAMPTVGYFWTPMALLQFTVLYATVFVAQYLGAGRPNRVGPVVWQAIYFALACGLLFPLLIPVVDLIIGWSEHKPEVKLLERAYFRGLSLAALPTLLLAAVNAFFAGRQRSWTVLIINVCGALSNALLAVPLILWQRDDPEAAMFGAGLATACDIVLAHEDAEFGYPEVRVGFVPAMVMSMLRRAVGEKHAADLVLTGRIISAEEAERIGLVSRVVPAATFDDDVNATLEQLSLSPATSLALTKWLFYKLDSLSFEDGIAAGVVTNVEARATEDFKAGVRRFSPRSDAKE